MTEHPHVVVIALFSPLLEIIGSNLKSLRNILIISKTMITPYTDATYSLLGHLNQGNNVIIHEIRLDDFIL